MTGGLQEQVTDGDSWFGVGIEPTSKAIVGSQQVPFIYEDRVSGEDVTNALLHMYEMPREERRAMGQKGHEYVLKNYNFENFVNSWDKLLTEVHEKYGSWDTRKNYNTWTMDKIA
jgi:glycosyltransferase involved in cell wall biosynthesis